MSTARRVVQIGVLGHRSTGIVWRSRHGSYLAGRGPSSGRPPFRLNRQRAHGTPTFFINGQRVVGAHDTQTLTALLIFHQPAA